MNDLNHFDVHVTYRLSQLLRDAEALGVARQLRSARRPRAAGELRPARTDRRPAFPHESSMFVALWWRAFRRCDRGAADRFERAVGKPAVPRIHRSMIVRRGNQSPDFEENQ